MVRLFEFFILENKLTTEEPKVFSFMCNSKKKFIEVNYCFFHFTI